VKIKSYRYWALILVVCFAHVANGDDLAILPVTVTSTSGSSVFIDKGSAHGIETGMSVWLSPPEGARIAAVVRFVSTNRARADLPPGIVVPPIGTRGEVEVSVGAKTSSSPFQGPTPTITKQNVPEHPPWSTDTPLPGEDSPLLAPIYGQRAEDRHVEVNGRLYFNSLYTHDQALGRNDDFYTGRAGISMEVSNLFKRGGVLNFDGEVNNRSQFLTDGEKNFEYDGDVELLSYTLGGQEYSTYRAEVGRFYSYYLPEFGLIDGAEWALKLDSGMIVGAGAGIFPLSAEDPEHGDDYGLHIFTSYDSHTPGQFSGVLGYQKTWHRGEEDRDQVLGRVNSRLNDTLWLFGSFRADIYASDDTIKGQGVELTELWTQVRYSPDPKYGGSVSYSLFRWPELKRDQFATLPIGIIRDGQVERVNFSTWDRINKVWRISGKFDLWQDQDTDGTGGEFRVDWNDRETDWPSLSSTVFFTQGSFNAGEGVRLDARKTIMSADVFTGYEYFMYDVMTPTGGDASLIRQLVRGGVSWSVDKWYYSITADHYFGDVDDEYTLGVFISRRF